MSDFKNCEDELNFVEQDRELAYIEIEQLKASNKVLSDGLVSAGSHLASMQQMKLAQSYFDIVNEHGDKDG